MLRNGIWIVLFLPLLLVSLILHYSFFLPLGSWSRYPIHGSDDSESEKSYTIYLTNNGWHQELMLPRDYCPFAFEVDRMLGREPVEGGYYIFGWGDRAFFLSTPYLRDLTFKKTVNALFLPSQSVLKIRYFPGEPQTGRRLRKIEVSYDQLCTLYEWVDRSLTRFGKLPPPVSADQVDPAYGSAVFYPANGVYTCLYTCNNWTGRALRLAGIQSGIWTPLPWGVGPFTYPIND